MDRKEALKLLRGGPDGIAEWNRRRGNHEEVPDLSEAELARADLKHAILDGVNFELSNLTDANLRGAHLIGASLFGADFSDANLHEANLCQATLTKSLLENATLCDALAYDTNFVSAKLTGADFSGCRFFQTILANLDLRTARGLDRVVFLGPCHLATSTFAESRGRVPESFLRGCGLQKWEILAARLHDPALTNDQVVDLHYEMIRLREKGPLIVGGVFISYAHEDAKFVDKVAGRLRKAGVPVWLDRHDMVAGDIQKQVDRAIRLNDVVLLILSHASVESDWVEKELQAARKKEKAEGRDVLCPVALDAAWKAKMDDVLWRQAFKKNVLDFSKWKTKSFEPVFDKLIRGLTVNYEKRPAAAADLPRGAE